MKEGKLVHSSVPGLGLMHQGCSSRFHRYEWVFASAAQFSDGLVVDHALNPALGISSNWLHSHHFRQFNKRPSCLRGCGLFQLSGARTLPEPVATAPAMAK